MQWHIWKINHNKYESGYWTAHVKITYLLVDSDEAH